MSIRYPGEYRWGSDYQVRHFDAVGRRLHKWEPAGRRRLPLPGSGVSATHEVQRCVCQAERARLKGQKNWRIIATGLIEVPDDFYPHA